MKKQKKLLSLLLFLACGIPAIAQNSMVVHFVDGSKAVFLLNERPRITFSGTQFVVTDNAETIEAPRTEVRFFNFEETNDTGVHNPIDTADATMQGDIVTISGLNNGHCARLLTVDGKTIATATAKEGSCTLSLQGLPGGIYLINYNDITIKYLKK